MTEKLSINLTEGDVDVKPAHGDDPNLPVVINYRMKCPLCETEIWLTRGNTELCDCNIEWAVQVKIVGKRALDDDDKIQMPLTLTPAEVHDYKKLAGKPETPEIEDSNPENEAAYWAKEADEMSDARDGKVSYKEPTEKPETSEFETAG